MEEYDRFFKYLSFFALFVISFYLMDKFEVEWLGILLGIGVYCVCYALVLIDLINSPKNSDMVILPLIIVILLVYISCIFMLSFMIKARKTYDGGRSYQWNTTPNDMEAMQAGSRKKLVEWKGMLVTIFVFTSVILFYYFVLDVDKYGNAESYFNFELGYKGIISGFTVILFIIMIPISIYMVYASFNLSRINNSKIVPESKDLANKTLGFPTKIKQNKILDFIFDNINLSTLSNYSIDIGSYRY